MPTITTDNTLIVGKLRSLLMDVTSSVNIITWVAWGGAETDVSHVTSDHVTGILTSGPGVMFANWPSKRYQVGN